MPSQLLENTNISFIVGKPFTYNGEAFEVGQDFPKETISGTLSNVETMVRNRFLIPVVDNLSDKPRHWYREVKERDAVLRKLGKAEESSEEQPEAQEDGFDPGDHTIVEVKAYVAEHPEELQSVIAAEESGRNRSTLLAWLHDQEE